jgi:hypothetical protein
LSKTGIFYIFVTTVKKYSNMKKALLVIALASFVGTSAFAIDHDKGKGKKAKCKKENCCKKSAATSTTGAAPAAEPAKCTKSSKGSCCSKAAAAPETK